MALNLSKDYTFSPNTLAKSSEVNADFDELYNAFSGLEAGTKSMSKLPLDADPTSALYAATKQYVDTTTAGVRVLSVVSKVTTYTATTSDDVILCSGSAFTVTLYTASGNTGRHLVLKKTDSTLTNIITIDGAGTETIDGALTKTLNTQYESYEIYSDGTNWLVKEHKCDTSWFDAGTITVTGTSVNPSKATTPDIDKVIWRRVGDNAEIIWKYRQSSTTGTASGTGQYLFLLPSSLVADTTLFPAQTTTNDSDVMTAYVGQATAARDASTNGIGFSYLYDTTHVWVKTINGAATYDFWSSTVFNFNGAAQHGWTITATIPISGWSI
jgi:hypothetical protein